VTFSVGIVREHVLVATTTLCYMLQSHYAYSSYELSSAVATIITCVMQVLECKKGALKAHQQLHATLGERASCEAQFQQSKQELKTEEDRLAGLWYTACIHTL
jgi:hypothetical protein